LGVVNSPYSQRSVESLLDLIERNRLGTAVDTHIYGTGAGAMEVHTLLTDVMTLEIAQLQPYSEEVGIHLGGKLLKLASK
jgi:hypothetical protein